MRYIISLFVVLFSTITTLSQIQTSPISIIRYNDNFSYLKTKPIKKGLEKLKYIALGNQNYISFGGEFRQQYQYFDNINFGDISSAAKRQSTGQLWQRILLHTNVELGSKVRIFVQLNSTFRFFNPNPIAPQIDENRLSLHQGFVDYSLNKNAFFRIGRQEMGYGNSRVLGFREIPNTRLTYDAAVFKYRNDNRKVDLIALTPVISNQYIFDDVSFKDFMIGCYGNEILVNKKALLDYYFFNFTSTTRKYNFVSGSENRQTFGFRFFSQNKRLNYELESSYQIGTFDNLRVAAYGINADVNYKFDLNTNCVLGIQANLFTGDKDKSDNQLNTFNALFSKPQFGLAAPIGSSNVTSINPYLKMNPLKKMFFYAGVYFLERQSNQDGTYSPAMFEVRPKESLLFASTNKIIGTQYEFETQYYWNTNFSTAIEGAYFPSGNYVKDTGKGLDILYGSVKATYKF